MTTIAASPIVTKSNRSKEAMPYIEHPSPLLVVEVVALFGLGLRVTGLNSVLQPSPGRLASIDGLRGVLAVSVYFHHFFIAYQWKHTGQWVAPPTHLYDLMGSCGVALFFMITGFLFFGRIRASRGTMNLNTFFVGRLFRLMPIYLLAVPLIYAAALRVTHTHWSTALQPTFDSWAFFRSSIIAGYGDTDVIDAGVHWTLAYEWIFYLSLPALAFIWALLRFEPWVIFILTVLSLSLVLLNPIALQLQGIFVAPFALGGLVGEVGRIPRIRRHAAGWPGSLVCIAALAAVFVSCATAYSVLGYLLLTLVFGPIALGNTLFGLLRTRTLLMLGEISYSIYMMHGLVIFGLFTLLMPQALTHASTPGRLLSLLLIASLCTMAAAMLVHVVIERPALRLGRRLVVINREQELAAP